MRLIDADALYNDICFSIDQMTDAGIAVDAEYLWGKLNDALDNAPTIEAVPKDFHNKTCEAMAKRHTEEIQRLMPKQGEWIPCSERLPEENVAVLTQAKFKDDIKMAVSARQDYNYWTGWGTREVNIVAWMPLPKPYGEREGE